MRSALPFATEANAMNTVERIYSEFRDQFQSELESTSDTKTRRALRHAIRRCKHVIEHERAKQQRQAQETPA